MKIFRMIKFLLALLFILLYLAVYSVAFENTASIPHNYLTKIELDSNTGELVKYFDAQGGYSPPEYVRNEGRIAVAEYFIKKYSVFPDKNAKLEEPFYNQGVWIISWKHYINGIEADEDYMNVLVTNDGMIEGFGKVWKTPDNASTTPSISKEEAINIALNHVRSNYVINQNFFLSDLRFYFPQETSLTVSESGLFWNVRVSERLLNLFGSTDNYDYLFKVDAFKGNVVEYHWDWRGLAKNPLEATYNIFTAAW